MNTENEIMSNLDACKIITIPTVMDSRGNLAVLEKDSIPFVFKRVYYLFDVPAGAYRGGHAHKAQYEFLIAVSGSFEVILKSKDGIQKMITLNNPNKGLLIATNIWRELKNFSSGSVCLVLSSDVFDEADYIRDYDEFMK